MEDNFVSASIVKSSTQQPVDFSASTISMLPTSTPITFTTAKGKFVNRDLTSVSSSSTEATTSPKYPTVPTDVTLVTSEKQNVISLAPNIKESSAPGTEEPTISDPSGEAFLSTAVEGTHTTGKPVDVSHEKPTKDEEIVPKVMPTLPPKNPQLNSPHDPTLMATRPEYLSPTFVLNNLQHVILTVKPNLTEPLKPLKPDTFNGVNVVDTTDEDEETESIEASGLGQDIGVNDVGQESMNEDVDTENASTTDTVPDVTSAENVVEDVMSENLDADTVDVDDYFRLSPELDSETVNSTHGTVVCSGTNETILVEKVCDGTIHCPGATDELDCCRKNLDPTMICDGVFDCPSLEDEIGCYKGDFGIKFSFFSSQEPSRFRVQRITIRVWRYEPYLHPTTAAM